MDQHEESGRMAAPILEMALKLPGGLHALRRVLARDGYALLRELVRDDALRTPPGEVPEVYNRLLVADGYRLFREVAIADGLAPLKAILLAGDYRLLDELLKADSYAALKQWLAQGEYARFREVALASNTAPLRAILFAGGYRILKELLAANGCEALKAVVLDDETGFFDAVVRIREGRPLAGALFADGASLLRDICRVRGDDALAPLLISEGRRYARAFPQPVKDEFAGRLLREGAVPEPEAFAANAGALQAALAAPRAGAVLALQRKWAALAGIVPQGDPGVDARYREALRTIQSPEHVRGRVLDAITDGDMVHLTGGDLQFPCRHSLWTLIQEILLNEDYFFESDTDTPVIIDGGAHIGMAVYYFKTLYPNARITAFEPEPSLWAMLEANVARNKYQDVTVLPYALAGERTSATFHASKQWSMAGSLTDHRSALGEVSETVTVECVPLSEYLDGPVDFLKLDIEGVEDEVLEEAAPKLGNVRHLFCEFHQGPAFAPGRLAKVIGLLDGFGFDVQIGKSHNFQETSRRRPLTHFGGGASQIIWGRQRQGNQ